MFGVRVALDIGRSRVGVAKSDPHGMLASPFATLNRKDENFLENLWKVIREVDAAVVYIGDPVNLKGKSTESTKDSREVAQILSEKGLQVRLVDERFTTVSAQRKLHATGRNTKNSRQIIDQAAAAVLLDYALEIERASGERAGYSINGRKL